MTRQTKILLLGDVNSIHFQKWILGLMDDFELAIFSLDPIDITSDFQKVISEKVLVYSNKEKTTNAKNKGLYLKSITLLRKINKQFKPDVVHAHYATSYGLLGSLLPAKIFLISVWGTDIYEFPKRSIFHKTGIRFILKKANLLLSTSNAMAQEINKYVNKEITVIPFGIDSEKFKPSITKIKHERFIIGTVKSLEYVYGIDRLIESFALFHKKYPKSECHIYGQGSKKKELEQLVIELGLEKSIVFKGIVSNDNVPAVLNQFDVFCALSRQESFGVAVVEASACGLPVIVTNVGGLPEVVENEQTGFIVQGELQEIAEKMVKLYKNSKLRVKMGEQGRQFVLNKYDWVKNLEQMKTIYTNLTK